MSDYVRTQVYLTRAHHRALRQLARKLGISMTEVLRRAVADRLEGPRRAIPIAKEDVLAFVGLGRGDRADVSERHDEALDEAVRGGRLR